MNEFGLTNVLKFDSIFEIILLGLQNYFAFKFSINNFDEDYSSLVALPTPKDSTASWLDVSIIILHK